MQHGTDYLIEKLDHGHQLSRFSLGDEPELRPLKSFLQRQALNYQNANVAVTYVAVLKPTDEAPQRKVIGYVTLTCSEVELGESYYLDDCEHANRFSSMPAMKVARLARHVGYKGHRIGETLMDFAIALAADQIGQSVGCRFLVTDAKRRSVKFYEGLGFTTLATDDNQERPEPVMFLDLNKIHGDVACDDLDAALKSAALDFGLEQAVS
ncbi:hypothetical protein [Stutzerimonas nitrititolerans]|uniref:hypothetical protein n=1 Tax=Stutzerimonas nitrititolerans TaxID=2482751 RepID=UPI0028B25B73|nr:hypothetical protein [Stutzerimonas nitrititolerans]